jgi:hemoglobin
MATKSSSAKALYARIGGYDKIAAIVDEFLRTFVADPKMARFTSAMSMDSRKRNRQLTVDYLCAAAGGPTFYIGPDMKTAHEGVGIHARDWKGTMAHIERALKKLKVPATESKEFLALFERARKQIVER